MHLDPLAEGDPRDGCPGYLLRRATMDGIDGGLS